MPLLIQYQPYVLNFKFEAGTSRGTMTEKTSWLVRITDPTVPLRAGSGHQPREGYGECGPLPGLSLDDDVHFETKLAEICGLFNSLDLEVFPFNLPIILEQLIPAEWPAIRFGIETALHDFVNGGERIVFRNDFSQKKAGIAINGLVWMGSEEFMQRQIEEKLAQGFTTIKIKVGAIDFAQECRVLERIRRRFAPSEIALRVDANGAFAAEEVEEKLNILAAHGLHSIEQPVAVGQTQLMAQVAATSPVPVALDEELIGKADYMEKFSLLKAIHPQYIILKPTLLGGFQQCREWIEIAQRLSIGWWITSALESNIGLNAIAQFTAQFDNPLPQGLGTGQIYENNFASPLEIRQGQLYADGPQTWGLAALDAGWLTV